MLPAEFEKPLALIELQCEAVAAAVDSGEPQALEAASTALRQAAVDFSAFMEEADVSAASPQLRARLKKIVTHLGIQREALMRRTAAIERSLHTLVPSTQKSTYAPAGRAGAYRGFAS
ncbi:MAG: hypothetical protein ACK5RC_06980 [Curvibacter sp.]|jgi:hypothetical protein|nr:hypothetical protein [Curvibacter sp.]